MPSSFEIISQYVNALQAKNSKKMTDLRSHDYIQDLVAGDAFLSDPASNKEVTAFWIHWFKGFEDMDYHVIRTVGSESVVVLEWILTCTHTGQLDPGIFGRKIEPTGNTMRLRGVSVFDINNDLIEKETMYIDLATLWIELGVDV